MCLLFESLDGCSGSETANACRARRDEMSVVCVWRTIEIVRDCEKTIIIIRLASEARRRRKKNCHKSHAQQFCTYSGRYMYDEMGITTRTNQRAIFFSSSSGSFVRSRTVIASAVAYSGRIRSENINQQEVKSDQRQKRRKKIV